MKKLIYVFFLKKPNNDNKVACNLSLKEHSYSKDCTRSNLDKPFIDIHKFENSAYLEESKKQICTVNEDQSNQPLVFSSLNNKTFSKETQKIFD